MRYRRRNPDSGASQALADLRAANLLTPAEASAIIGQDMPEYLKSIAAYMVAKRQQVRAGALKPSDVAKAILVTIASQGTEGTPPETVERKLHWRIPERFITRLYGKRWLRPEEAMAAWIASPEGRYALQELDRGHYDPYLFRSGAAVRQAFADDRFLTANALGERAEPGKNKLTLADSAKIAEHINRGSKSVASINALAAKINGVGAGKLGFVKHLLGFGDTPTVDGVELNFWLTGQGRVKELTTPEADVARAVKEHLLKGAATNKEVYDIIARQIAALRQVTAGARDLPDEVAAHILHHWIWDRAKKTETTHAGIYAAMNEPSEYSITEGPGDVPLLSFAGRQEGMAARPQWRGQKSITDPEFYQNPRRRHMALVLGLMGAVMGGLRAPAGGRMAWAVGGGAFGALVGTYLDRKAA